MEFYCSFSSQLLHFLLVFRVKAFILPFWLNLLQSTFFNFCIYYIDNILVSLLLKIIICLHRVTVAVFARNNWIIARHQATIPTGLSDRSDVLVNHRVSRVATYCRINSATQILRKWVLNKLVRLVTPLREWALSRGKPFDPTGNQKSKPETQFSLRFTVRFSFSLNCTVSINRCLTVDTCKYLNNEVRLNKE